MCKAFKKILLFGILIVINFGIAFGSGWDSGQDRSGKLCFEETVKLANGASPETLKTIHCDRASKIRALGREYRSAMLYNRGIIERAQGDIRAAEQSFAKSVRLSNTIDERNLALAEVERERGNYRAAVEQYDLLIESGFGAESAVLQSEIFARQQEAGAIYYASVDKAQACGSCHGADGISTDPQYPSLAGREADYLDHALRQFKSGERQNVKMTAQAAKIADDDIALLADYFASLDGR